jgi:hypothetical protein
MTLDMATGVRGDTGGWRNALQVGRSRVRFPMVSLEFFIDINLPAALWPWGWLSLTCFPWVKAAGTTFMCRLSWKSGILSLLEHSGPVQACNRIALPLHMATGIAQSACRLCYGLDDRRIVVRIPVWDEISCRQRSSLFCGPSGLIFCM